MKAIAQPPPNSEYWRFLRRLTQSPLVLLAMSVLVFVGVYLIGNLVDIPISSQADQTGSAIARSLLGLDKPLWSAVRQFRSRRRDWRSQAQLWQWRTSAGTDTQPHAGDAGAGLRQCCSRLAWYPPRPDRGPGDRMVSLARPSWPVQFASFSLPTFLGGADADHAFRGVSAGCRQTDVAKRGRYLALAGVFTAEMAEPI